MTEYIKCAMRNLSRKKFRTVLTMISIGIGVASVVLISAIGDIGKEAMNNELNGLGVGSVSISVDRQFNNILLKKSDVSTIEKMNGIESVVPVMMEYSSISMRGLVANVAIWGIDAGADQIFSLNSRYGKLLSKNDISSGTNVCLVDTNTAVGFYERENIVGKSIKLLIAGNYVDFTVAGIVESGGNAMQNLIGDYLPMFVYVPYSTMQRLLGRSGFDRIAVKVDSSTDVDAAAESIVHGLEIGNGTKGAYMAENMAQQKDKLNNLMNIVTALLSAIAAISLVVAGLGIMTVMLVSVNERTKEIGIKKSIGANSVIIMYEFLAEAFAISTIGSLIGAAFGAVIALFGCIIFKLKFILNIKMILFVISFAVASGMIFGAYPSWVASKLKPVDALRHE
ncbi:MAG: ABC transporter permease [Hydrogenoanaerobacterium sp.]